MKTYTESVDIPGRSMVKYTVEESGGTKVYRVGSLADARILKDVLCRDRKRLAVIAFDTVSWTVRTRRK